MSCDGKDYDEAVKEMLEKLNISEGKAPIIIDGEMWAGVLVHIKQKSIEIISLRNRVEILEGKN